MYLRRINVKKSGKDHYYWALVESYRTEKGSRQRIVGYIGDMAKKARARGTISALERCDSVQQDFLSPEELPEFADVLPRKTRTERQRQFGGVWLGNKLFEKLELGRYFTECLAREKEAVDWLDIISKRGLRNSNAPASSDKAKTSRSLSSGEWGACCKAIAVERRCLTSLFHSMPPWEERSLPLGKMTALRSGCDRLRDIIYFGQTSPTGSRTTCGKHTFI